jgi:hypothetical protein
MLTPTSRHITAYFGSKKFELGLQTSFLTKKRPTLRDAARAVAMVEGTDAAFVGILEDFSISILLFHCLFMPNQRPRSQQLKNIHPTVYTKISASAVVPDDPIDNALYAAAKKRFKRDVQDNWACISSKSSQWNVSINAAEYSS